MIIEKGICIKKDYINQWIQNESYDDFKNIRQVSAICVDDDGKILLIKNPNKEHWTLPGGTPENNESVEETLIREIGEEASCDIEIISLLGAIKVNFPDNPNKDEGEEFHQLRFLAKIKSVNPATIDPANDIILDRIFVKPENFLDYIPWTSSIGQELLRLTLEKQNK